MLKVRMFFSQLPFIILLAGAGDRLMLFKFVLGGTCTCHNKYQKKENSYFKSAFIEVFHISDLL
jgi:hypothetical protein